MTYKVYVDDNYHYMDQDHRYELGAYASFDEAVEASKKIVDAFLIENKSKYETSDELCASYTMFGEDPFIMAKDASNKFSARTYAQSKCKELFKNG
jgi:hypothetical protein